MIECYKILHGFYTIESPLTLQCAGRTRGHSLKLMKCHGGSTRRHFFAERVVNPWNSLTEDIVSVLSLNCFKARLDRFWEQKRYLL